MVNLFHTACSEEEIEVVSTVLRSGKLVMGQQVADLETELSVFLGLPDGNVVTCASGTDALKLALEALGVGRGEYVLVPAATFSATAEAVLNMGAEPILVDIAPGGFTPSFEQWKTAYESAVQGPVVAIIAVHLYGWLSADIRQLAEYCTEKNILLIEDCAQALGATGGGLYGSAAAFSFYPTKPLGGIGDGGAVSFRDDRWATWARKRRNHGRDEANVQHIAGYNSRLDEANAAVLRLRLARLFVAVGHRREIAVRYAERFGGLRGIDSAVPYVYPLRVPADARDGVRAKLAILGTQTGAHYDPALSGLPYFKGADCPNAERLAKSIITLPCHHAMVLQDVAWVMRSVEQTLFEEDE